MIAAGRFGGVFGLPVMKFALTYDGELPPCSNSSRKSAEKWQIRKVIAPQLEELWLTHPSLKVAQSGRYIPKDRLFGWYDVHHLAETTSIPNRPRSDTDLDLCEEIQAGPYRFLPLVRKSFALICGITVLFMRKGPVGRIYQGGDLDNRIKTLLDALRVPTDSEIAASKTSDDPSNVIHCLLEDDALVSGLNIETRQLLNRPGSPETDVRLLMDIDVRVTHPRFYNTSFLGD